MRPVILQIVDKHIEILTPSETHKVLAVFGTANGSWLWLATKATGEAPNRIFFGLVYGFAREWGYFNERDVDDIAWVFDMTKCIGKPGCLVKDTYYMADWEDSKFRCWETQTQTNAEILRLHIRNEKGES